ncbi:amidohydrolase family protein [Sunxiuqinia sp. A32]|uniref:amidohydrolase family protein n=1 Tax=Sunxiuqinia sp. A32 TaxID=3461496 RepID=UPI00404655A9
MPSIPIIDTHLHLWDPQNHSYPWLEDEPSLNKPFLLPEYKEATGSFNIDKMVFVQCECEFSQCEQEAEWVAEQAKNDNRIQGIVPWAPLEDGRAAKNILDRYSDNKLIKGIRRIIQFEPDPMFCLKPDFVQGVKLLADYDMSFDICISHVHLENTIELIKQCPNVLFILDHIGKPDIKGKTFDPWKKEIKELSLLDNVFCKISGLVTEADQLKWTKDDLTPYFDHVIESFGFDKVMFGGDWPVVTQASTYKRWVNTLDELLVGVTENEIYKLYRGNAMSFYKLS